MNGVAYLALFVSIISLGFNIIDRFARLKVDAGLEVVFDIVENAQVAIDKRIWITITNNSARRVFITTISAVWSWYLFFPVGRSKIDLDDIQRYEGDKSEPTTRFWIEPWGNVVLSADGVGVEQELYKYFFKKYMFNQLLRRSLTYRIVVCNAQQKNYYSKKIKLITPKWSESKQKM